MYADNMSVKKWVCILFWLIVIYLMEFTQTVTANSGQGDIESYTEKNKYGNEGETVKPQSEWSKVSIS